MRVWKKLAVISLFTALLGGCAVAPSITPIPASFLQPCDDLELLKGKDGKACLNVTIENAEIYHACKDSKQALIDAVKSRQK